MHILHDNQVGPFLTNIFGEKYLHSVNRDSFTKMSSDEVFRDFFGENFFKENSFYLIAGSDSGLLPSYIMKNGVPEGSRFVILEPPEVLEHLHEVLNFEELDPCIAVTTLKEMNTKLEEFRISDYIYADKAFYVSAICATDRFFSAYQTLYEQARATMEEAVDHTRSNFITRRYIIGQLRNLAENRVPSDILRGAFKGKTAVLLGVGPSLDDVLPWVVANRDKIVLLVVSRAARRLREEGVVPDLIFSIDPTDYSFDVSREMLHFWPDSVFFYGHHTALPLLAQWPGRAFYLGKRFPWETPLNQGAFLLIGPTVTQMAIKAAIDLGFSRVLMGGVDLCFNQEGYVYGKSTQGREKGRHTGNIKEGVETNGGWRAGTILAFKLAAQVTRSLAAAAKTWNCQLINLSAGAAKIEGVDYLPPEEIQLEALECSPLEVVDSIVTAETNESRANHYTAMLDELRRVKGKFSDIKELAEKALKANENLFGRNGKKPNFRNKKIMDNVEKSLNHDFDDLPKFVKQFGILRFLKIIRPNKQTWTDEEIELSGKIYYQAFRDTADELVKLTSASEQRLLTRIEEESFKPNFSNLAKTWIEEKQYGRGWVWKLWHPEKFATLCDEEQELFRLLQKRFDAVLDRQAHLTKAPEPPKVNSKTIHAKARALFRQRDRRGLEALAANLKDTEEPNAAVFLALVSGFIAETAGDIEGALGEYEKILNADASQLLEDALGRIAQLSSAQQNIDNTLLALECLAGISPIYQPKYADLLWLIGEQKTALDIYADYLGKVPADLAAMLQLGKYYQQLNSSEGARMAFEYVLEKDPQNTSAKTLLAILENKPAL